MGDSPAVTVRQHLTDLAITAMPIFVGTEPAEPDECVTIYDTGGNHANQDAGLQDPTIQIRVRARNYGAAYQTLAALRDALIRPTTRIIGDWFYTGFWITSDIAKIGRDENNRELLVVNLRAMRQKILGVTWAGGVPWAGGVYWHS